MDKPQMPGPDHLLSFHEAQNAVQAINDAWQSAVDEIVEDHDLRVRIHQAAEGNAYQAMFMRIAHAMSIAESLDQTYNPVVEDPIVALKRILLGEVEDERAN